MTVASYWKGPYRFLLATAVCLAALLAATSTANAGFFAPGSFTGAYSGAAVADFNGDKFPEIVASKPTGGIAVHLQVYGNVFSPTPQSFNTGVAASSTAVATGDLNSDGRADVVVTNGDSSVTVFLRTVKPYGDPATFTTKTYALYANSKPGRVALGDVSGDGRLDIVAGNTLGTFLSVLPAADQNGNFGALKGISLGDKAESLAVGDIGGNGSADIVATSKGSKNVYMLIRSSEQFGGANIFLPKKQIQLPERATGVALGDVSGDKLIDIVAAYDSPNSGQDGVSVITGKQAGEFDTTENFLLDRSGSGEAGDVAIGDFNRDSRNDIAAYVPGDQSNIAVLIRSYKEKFGGEKSFFDPYRASGVYGQLVTGDFIDDKLSDIVTAGATGVTYLSSRFLWLYETPSVTGEPKVGETLMLKNGYWVGETLNVSFLYQWFRCSASDPDSCDAISGAVTQNYVPTASDVGHRLRAVLTGVDGNGSIPAATPLTGTVYAAPSVAVTSKSNPAVAILSREVVMSKKRNIKVRVGCSKQAVGVCKFTFKLARDGRKVGSKSSSLKPGKEQTLTVRLSKGVTKLIRSRKRLGLNARTVSVDRSGASKVVKKNITVKPAGAKKSKKRRR